MSKKMFSLFLVLCLMCSALAFSVSAEDTVNPIDTTEPHICTTQAVGAVAATCTSDGTEAHEICTCGKIYQNGVEVTAADLVIEKLEHSWTWVIDREATEEVSGLKHEECSCGAKQNEGTIIPVKEHVCSFDQWEFDAYRHWKECKCGEKAYTNVHSWKWVTDKAAQVGVSGIMHEECECGAMHSMNSVIPALEEEHFCDFCIWHYDNTYHWYECECGEKDTRSIHTWKWVIDKAAEAGVEGVKHEQCECGATKSKNTVIPALEEEHVCDFIVRNFDEEFHWKECECGKKSEEQLHIYGSLNVEGNVKTNSCVECGYESIKNLDTSDENVQDDVDNINEPKGENITWKLILGLMVVIALFGGYYCGKNKDKCKEMLKTLTSKQSK